MSDKESDSSIHLLPSLSSLALFHSSSFLLHMLTTGIGMAIFVVEVGVTTMTDSHDQGGMVVAGGRTGRGVTGEGRAHSRLPNMWAH